MPFPCFPPSAENRPLTDDMNAKRTLIKNACHSDLSSDVKERPFTCLGKDAVLFFLDGMADSSQITRCILFPCQTALCTPPPDDLYGYLCKQVLPIGNAENTLQLKTALEALYNGDAVMLMDGLDGALVLDVKGYASRGISSPKDETVIVGPHEGFTETLKDNMTLMRRLMRSPHMIIESMSAGNHIPKQLCLIYLKDIAPEETVHEIKRRLDGCNVDYVANMGILEQLLEDDPYALLPQAVYTERPDRACSFLLEGQVVLLLENSPYAMAMPAGLPHLLHAPDDSAMRWQYGSFLRLLRMAGLMLAIVLPGLYVALSSFHPEGLPVTLLTSVLETQSKVPLPLFPSMLIMLFIFCLINEAGTRVPGALGSGLNIVGGLILGQAAITANLFSPLVIIVIALSGLGSYAAPSYSLTLSIRLFQFLLLILSGLFGFLGLMGGLFFLLMRSSAITSLNRPANAPFTPYRASNPDQALRLPVWRQRLRGALANPLYMDRTHGRMRAWEKRRNDP